MAEPLSSGAPTWSCCCTLGSSEQAAPSDVRGSRRRYVGISVLVDIIGGGGGTVDSCGTRRAGTLTGDGETDGHAAACSMGNELTLAERSPGDRRSSRIVRRRLNTAVTRSGRGGYRENRRLNKFAPCAMIRLQWRQCTAKSMQRSVSLCSARLI